MKVLVTGGTGTVGQPVTERLVKHGWDVHVIGLDAEIEVPGATYAQCDIMQYDALREAMHGCRAVVHLAAISHPMSVPGQEIFQINGAGTFNVFEAAAAEGIKRVVQASSINAFGCFWGLTEISPHYLPIDEDHPTYTTDAYSFSKEAVEGIGAYYWRREGISSIAFRLPGVWTAQRSNDTTLRQRQREVAAHIDDLAAQPEAKRQTRLAELRQQAAEYRRQRRLEYPAAQGGIGRDDFSDDPLWVTYTFDRFSFWTYIDEKDSAQAMEKGLTAEFEGSHPLFVCARHNWLNYDSQTLAQLFFPEVSRWKKGISGAETLVSFDQARALIGFEPEYSL